MTTTDSSLWFSRMQLEYEEIGMKPFQDPGSGQIGCTTPAFELKSGSNQILEI